MSLYDSVGVLAVIPARNEERDLAVALSSVLRQTARPQRIIVVVNNSTDRTLHIARQYARHGVEVINLPDNPHMKAGALNAGIAATLDASGLLPPGISYVLTMDGDTMLEPDFVENCTTVMRTDRRLGGVSAACLGRRRLGDSPWQRMLTLMQEIEYARHHTGRFRRNVHTMSGAGSFYRAAAVQQILDDRGRLFREDSANLVEDYETTLELKERGWRVTSNYHCVAHTDLMPTLRSLVGQRTRWVRGTVDELRRRGLRRSTLPGFAGLLVGTVGTLVMAAWVAWGVHRTFAQGASFDWRSLTWGAAWPAYQAWQVRRAGWRAVLVELLIVPELLFGALRQFWLYRSLLLSFTTSARLWA